MLLIFEPHNGGHRIEYIDHLIKYIKTNPSYKQRVVFCLNEKLIQNLKESIEGLVVLEFSEKLNVGNSLHQSKKHLEFLKGIIDKALDIECVLFMNLDLYRWTLIWDRSLKNILIKGILFQPGYRISLDSIFNYFRKTIQFVNKQLLIRFNQNIDKVFILNDAKTVDKYNQFTLRVCGKNKYYYLPDPIDCKSNFVLVDNKTLREKWSINNEKTILLVFGGIDERKNISTILKALTSMSSEYRSRLTLIIAGKLLLRNKNEYYAQLEKTRLIAPELEIKIYNTFITDEDKEELFCVTDIVLMPYINFYSSSGVLGHAAKYSKPVIASNAGLINELVQKFKLGLTVNSKDYKEIASAIIKGHYEKINTKILTNNTFLEDHSPFLFSSKLLD